MRLRFLGERLVLPGIQTAQSAKGIEQYRGTSLWQPLELAFQKCMGQMADREQFTRQNLDELFSFRPFAPEDAELRLFEMVTQAVRVRRGSGLNIASWVRRCPTDGECGHDL